MRRIARRRQRLLQRPPGDSQADRPVQPVKLERERFAQHMAALYGGGVEKWLAEFDRGLAKRQEWDAHGSTEHTQ